MTKWTEADLKRSAKNTPMRHVPPTQPPTSPAPPAPAPLLCQVSTYDFQGTKRVVFPKVPIEQIVAFVAHCQRFQPEQ